MAAGTKIRGITIELGGDASGLSKALKDVNKDINSTQKQLKDVERLLKMDPGNMELLRQKQQLLNKEIGETDTKLEALKKAEKQVQEQFAKGEASEDQYNALKREIIATESKLGSLRSEADKTDKAIKGIDEGPVEEVADAAKEAEDALNDAGKEASSFGDYLKAGAIIEGAKGIISSLKGVAEETKEYRKIMGSLEVSSGKAGYTAKQTEEIYKQLYGVLGDDQTAATTTANLQALGFAQEDLKKITNAAIGAWATYGDSIPIDGLAESINETAKVGTVTGTLADALNWAGVSEDEFNEKLEKAGSASERADMILQQLVDQGLADAGQAWRNNSKALVESNEAQADLQEQMAELGELITPIITKMTQAGVAVLQWFNSLDEGTQMGILALVAIVATLGPVMALFGSLTGTVLPAVQTAFSSTFSFIAANPVVLLIAAIVGLVALIALKGDEIQDILQKIDSFLEGVFAVDWTTVFGPVIGDAVNGFMRNMQIMWTSLKQILNGIMDFIRGVFTGDWERAWSGIVQIFGGIFSGLEGMAKIPINGIISLINGAISGINILAKGANKIPGVNIGTIGKIPYLANGGVLSQGSAVVGEAGPELLTMMGGKAVVQPLTSQTSTYKTEVGGIHITVYGAPGQDEQEIADLVSEKISAEAARKGAVFA